MKVVDFEQKYLNKDIDMKTVLFLLKKMEYTNKVKYDINNIIKDIEQDIKLERGFNPFKNK